MFLPASHNLYHDLQAETWPTFQPVLQAWAGVVVNFQSPKLILFWHNMKMYVRETQVCKNEVVIKEYKWNTQK